MQEVSATVKRLPGWAVPAAIGAGLGLFTLWRKSRAPVAPVAPVAAIATAPKSVGLAGADYGDVQGLLADQNRRNEERNAALQSAFEKGIADISAKIPAPTTPTDGGKGTLPGTTPVITPIVTVPPVTPPPGRQLNPPPLTGPNPAPSSPVTGPAAPVLPVGIITPPPPAAPSPPPPPSTAPPSSGGKATGPDWEALAYYLGGKGWSPGGLHYAGEVQQINWNAPPYSAGEPPPPTGVYPAAPLPVNFNGSHAAGRYPFGINPWSESAYIRTLRWTANYMESNPDANPQTVWDGMLGRLMRDMGPVRGTNWFDTGFDLGNVRNSPFLDGNGTPNPAWQNIY